jgi:hypothetical protein
MLKCRQFIAFYSCTRTTVSVTLVVADITLEDRLRLVITGIVYELVNPAGK